MTCIHRPNDFLWPVLAMGGFVEIAVSTAGLRREATRSRSEIPVPRITFGPLRSFTWCAATSRSLSTFRLWRLTRARLRGGGVSWHFSLNLLYFIPSSSLSVLLLIGCKNGKGSSANLFCDVKIQWLKMGQTNVFWGWVCDGLSKGVEFKWN